MYDKEINVSVCISVKINYREAYHEIAAISAQSAAKNKYPFKQLTS